MVFVTVFNKEYRNKIGIDYKILAYLQETSLKKILELMMNRTIEFNIEKFKNNLEIDDLMKKNELLDNENLYK